MAKTRSRYVCSNCGRVTAAYVGKCPKCGEFNTMEEEVLVAEAPASQRNRRAGQSDSQPQRLAEITADGFERLPLPLPEFGRVLGGGIVPGSLVLVGGDPGIGKSTLLLDVSALTANAHGTTLYVSGEESKFGFTPAGLQQDVEALLGLPNLNVSGLMTIPPYDPDPELARPHFAALRALQEDLVRQHGAARWRHLSMGMSHDFEVAIQEGATLVRVGTAIFGTRDSAASTT